MKWYEYQRRDGIRMWWTQRTPNGIAYEIWPTKHGRLLLRDDLGILGTYSTLAAAQNAAAKKEDKK